ncbi:ABC transporter ATP-binding protein [Nostocoides veronense]|uniref:ABC transporter ATP-binding protein n=1 Tax=Nostocoides veronense TaxID=330836 RepID=A0ABN2LI20_9MICO
MTTTTAYDRPRTTAASAARDLVKTYGSGAGEVTALKGVTVTVGSGELTAIMGPSGSGKSTLMHCLAGLDTATSGQIFLGDTEIGALSDAQLSRLRRDRLGFVFQSFNLVPTLTARQNITLPARLAGRPVDAAWLTEIAGTLGISDRLDHRPSELSGGQQQRVAVARALIGSPDVIFADEPTGALDRASSTALLGFLRRCVRELGQTVVLVTHDPSVAAYADRVLLLADGQLVDEVRQPSADTVLHALSRLGA